jgi:hypothetical protein
MKKLFSLAALGALLYAMPMNACMLLGILPYYDPTAVILLPIALFLLVQALLLRHANHKISYPKALLMACVGNIPSTIIGYFPSAWQFLGKAGLIYIFPIIDITLTTLTISIIFRYPSSKIVRSIVVSAVAFYIIAIVWIYLDAPGIRFPTAPY